MLFPFHGFTAKWIKHPSNPFDAIIVQAPRIVLLVNDLKTSSMDSVTTYI